MKTSILFAAAASMASLSLASCATAPMEAAMAGDMTPEMAAPYAQTAAASDLFEIRSSQLALQRSRNQSVREFAQMMITHHTHTTQQLTAAASAAGVSAAPRLMPVQEQMLTQLNAAQGAEFDRMYMMQQVQAHEMAVALHSNYARAGDNAALRAVAAAATPIVTQHLARARQIAG